MKKIKISVLFLICIILGLCFGNSNAQEAKTPIKYPDWDLRHVKRYSDELMKKYPDYFLDSGFKPPTPFEVRKNQANLFGVYNTKLNKMIIPYEHEYIKPCIYCFDMFFHAKSSGEEKIIDYKNNIVYESKKYKLDCRNQGGIITSYQGKYGIVDYTGKEISVPQYDSIETQRNYEKHTNYHYYIVQKGNKYAVINENNKFIIPYMEEKISSLDLYYFKTEKDGKYGVIDILGNRIIPNKYEFIKFERPGSVEDYFFVRNFKTPYTAFINLNGDIEFQADKNLDIIRRLSPDRFIVNINENDENDENEYAHTFLMDMNGNILTKKGYYTIMTALNDNFFTVTKYDEESESILYGLITKDGKVILEPSLANKDIKIIYVTDEGLAIVMKKTDFGILYDGRYLLQPKYGIIDYKDGYLFIQKRKNKFKSVKFNDFKVSKLKEDNKVYIMTPNELIKNNGDLSKFKMYDLNDLKNKKQEQ